MKKIILSLFALFAMAFICPAQTSPSSESSVTVSMLNDALSQLDDVLTNRNIYIEARQQRIDSLKSLWRESPDNAMYLNGLVEEYTSFNTDSALYYMEQGLSLPWPEGTRFRWRHAKLLPLTGYVGGAEDEFRTISAAEVPDSMKAEYLEAGRQMYSYVADYYHRYPHLAQPYIDSTLTYQRALLEVIPQGDLEHKYHQAEYFFRTGHPNRARILLEELIDEVAGDYMLEARVAHHLAEVALQRGDRRAYLYYLALSARADVQSATREMMSLQELGTNLTDPSEVVRAYKYLTVALENAVECGATVRTLDTSAAIPLIEKNHSAQIEKWRRGVYWIIGALAFALLGLGVLIFMLRRDMTKMSRLQRNLERANKTKETYISQFLTLCSVYMDKLNNFSNIVNRKLSAGQADELLRMIKSGRFVEQQTHEFFEIFDDAFLHIYPNFVEEVNKLLKPDARIELKEGELLNTDLRILALYRMGIDDSAQIAKVLNYSLNTIYSYRNRLKSRAINRDTFEADVASMNNTRS